MKTRLIGVLVAVACCHTLLAQTSAEQVIGSFFGPSGIRDKRSVYTGEMLQYHSTQPTLGQMLDPDVKTQTRLLGTSSGLSIYEVTLAARGQTQDWYAYLVQDHGRWKLEAVRSLALTGIPAMLLDALTQKASRSADEEWQLRNLQLLFESDAGLKRFVAAQLPQLDRVADLELAGKSEDAQAVAKSIFIHDVTKTTDGRLELIVGGILNNAVGFMFVPDGVTPPPMSPKEYIYIEKVTGAWYVFKTT